jgi:LuxR family transcriptional regulator, quorum-sensing system regulator BjaR1
MIGDKSREEAMDLAFFTQPISHGRTTNAVAGITLSKREQEVLQWAAEGKSEWEIGLILGLSEHTAEKFIRSARIKLQAGNRTHAVALAIRLGLIA